MDEQRSVLSLNDDFQLQVCHDGLALATGPAEQHRNVKRRMDKNIQFRRRYTAARKYHSRLYGLLLVQSKDCIEVVQAHGDAAAPAVLTKYKTASGTVCAHSGAFGFCNALERLYIAYTRQCMLLQVAEGRSNSVRRSTVQYLEAARIT